MYYLVEVRRPICDQAKETAWYAAEILDLVMSGGETDEVLEFTVQLANGSIHDVPAGDVRKKVTVDFNTFFPKVGDVVEVQTQGPDKVVGWSKCKIVHFIH